ncbi:MAG: hypothetical protein IIB44_07290 [Candidatus Marinimicrobia bacterium]|nr:hypothetical protein [Candidatus Neomarinimicrobiota bacterium]
MKKPQRTMHGITEVYIVRDRPSCASLRRAGETTQVFYFPNENKEPHHAVGFWFSAGSTLLRFATAGRRDYSSLLLPQ